MGRSFVSKLRQKRIKVARNAGRLLRRLHRLQKDYEGHVAVLRELDKGIKAHEGLEVKNEPVI